MRQISYRIKICNLLEGIRHKEDLLYLPCQDFYHVIMEVFKRKGYEVKPTQLCGEEENGLLLNGIQFCELGKHSLRHIVDVEAAMKLSRKMSSNQIHRGMLISLGDFRQNTRLYCHSHVIECINGNQLLQMCKEMQRRHEVAETN